MIRSHTTYEQLLSSLSSRYRKLDRQGFESHLFIDDDSIFKLYRWHLLESISLSEEKTRFDHQNHLLGAYAPRLLSSIIAFFPDGSWKGMPEASGVVCYGLKMRKGEPLQYTFLNKEQSTHVAGRIGAQLAVAHERAPSTYQVQLHHCKEGFARMMEHLARLLEQECVGTASGSAFKRKRLSYFTEEIWKIAGGAQDSSPCPVIHGDSNLGNVIAYNGEIQFIDPCYALPFGLGIDGLMPFGLGWDLASMALSIFWYSDIPETADYWDSYCRNTKLPRDKLLRETSFYMIIYCLMLLIVTRKLARQQNLPPSPLANLLALKRVTVETYLAFLTHIINKLLGLDAFDVDICALEFQTLAHWRMIG